MTNSPHNCLIQAQVEQDQDQPNQRRRQWLSPKLFDTRRTRRRTTNWLRKTMRPSSQPGYRRIEWTCECGEDLYANFENDNSVGSDALEASLRQATHSSGSGGALDGTNVLTSGCINGDVQNQSSVAADTERESSINDEGAVNGIYSRHLAVCISSGGIYKRLTEIDVSTVRSDAELFSELKNVYQSVRKLRLHLAMFLKPVSVEFIQSIVWSIHQGYISICDRPRCVPPIDEPSYDFSPHPMAPLPPVPPEIFLRYLEHRDISKDVARYIWTPRLPKRTGKRVIDCDMPTYAWGIYIREGPHRGVLFCIVMITVILSTVLCILWAALKDDVQGGSGLGILIIAVPSVIMAASMFRISDTS
ncbi:hypothetical protein BU25DRAFT_387197 [Macroventuria anomochaeta]|uniref:Uncharacterized protein n=1 Tax=Macroventuria anomochaeta TaxID=301207 RepID=A0ACB6SA45_9PLEO|nr:uncharacterized protein BU25DRAFT_387197 [Macroventuria anomochaeta]KAF2630918.1 hypothetical protein BU25DRAFT_387197 [Macroventuria anomochaeta]